MKAAKCFASVLAMTSHLTLFPFLELQCTNLLPGTHSVYFRGLQCADGARLHSGNSEAMQQEDPNHTDKPSDEDMEGVLEGPSGTQPNEQQQPQQSEKNDFANSSDSESGAAAGAYGSCHSDSSDSSDGESSPRQPRQQARGVQTSFSHLRASPMVTRTQQHSPAGAGQAKTVTSQISGLLRPLPKRRSSGSGWFRRARGRAPALPVLAHSVKAFLLPVPKRRSGFQQPMKSYSEGAVKVVRHLSSLLPMKIKSALHEGATKVLSVHWAHPVIYSPGRVSVCVNFEGEPNSPPLYLTALFIEDRKQLGQDAARLMYRVGAAQQLATRAGLRRAADVGRILHVGTPVDVVPLSDDDVVDLDSTLLSGKALLEPRLWAPLTSVLRRIDQAEGMQHIRLADQARSSLTQQVVEVVAGIRASRFVLPRVIPEDFWLDEAGQLFYLPRDITNLLSEGDSIKPPSAAAQKSEASTSTDATPTGSGGEVVLNQRSNSIALGLFIMQMWCRLTPEQSKAHTPALEAAAALLNLDFSSCLSGMPQEVKQLIMLLHGGRTSLSIPAAEAVASKPYLALQTRLEYTDALGRGTIPRWSRHKRRSAGSSHVYGQAFRRDKTL